MQRIAAASLLLTGMVFGIVGLLKDWRVVYLGVGDLKLQTTAVTCGPAALSFVLSRHGELVDEYILAQAAETDQQGTSMLGLVKAAELYGYKAVGYHGSYEDLKLVDLPVIVLFYGHFVVVTGMSDRTVIVADPLAGFMRYGRRAFIRNWTGQMLVVTRG